jgi:hypothetical protein
MMCFISKMWERLMGFMSHSQYASKVHHKCNMCFQSGDNRAILMIPPLKPMMLNFIYSHWWCLMRINIVSLSFRYQQVVKHAMIWWSGSLLLRKSCKIICWDGNLHVLLLMMLHKNYEHCGKFIFSIYKLSLICYYLLTNISYYFISHFPSFGNDVHYVINIFFFHG